MIALTAATLASLSVILNAVLLSVDPTDSTVRRVITMAFSLFLALLWLTEAIHHDRP